MAPLIIEIHSRFCPDIRKSRSPPDCPNLFFNFEKPRMTCSFDLTYWSQYMTGFSTDVVQIQKSGDLFRLLYNTKGRFVLHRISEEESKFKLCRVNKVEMSKNKIPYLVTHDGRTIRYPDPLIKVMKRLTGFMWTRPGWVATCDRL